MAHLDQFYESMHYGRAVVKKKIQKSSATVRAGPRPRLSRQHHDTSAAIFMTHTHKEEGAMPKLKAPACVPTRRAWRRFA